MLSHLRKFPKPGLYSLLICLALVVGTIGPLLTGSLSSNVIDLIFQSLGAALGILAFAGIPAFLIRLIFKNSMSDEKNFLLVLIFLVLIIGVLVILGQVASHEGSNTRKLIKVENSKESLPKRVGTGDQLVEKVEGFLYRNHEYHFRIVFPQNWEVKDGLGANVVKVAEKFNIGSVNVLVRPTPEKINSNEVSDRDLHEIGRNIIQPVLDRLSGELIHSKVLFINNQKSLNIKTQVLYKKIDGDSPAINDMYLIYKNGYLFLITTSCYLEVCPEVNDIFKSTVDSFVIEDWG